MGSDPALRPPRTGRVAAVRLCWLASFLALPGTDSSFLVPGVHGSARADNRGNPQLDPTVPRRLARLPAVQPDGRPDHSGVNRHRRVVSLSAREEAASLSAARELVGMAFRAGRGVGG